MAAQQRTLQAKLNTLADIDAHVEHVALGTKDEGNMNILAHSIHNLVNIVEEVVREQAKR